MSGFKLVRRGYDAKEVDDFIAKNNAYLEDKLKEQKLRISELKKQNLKLAGVIKEMRLREDGVKNALVAASQKAKDIMSAAKIKYALEGQRLKLLQSKWTEHFERQASSAMGQGNEYAKMQAYFLKMETELHEILKSDFGILQEKKAKEQGNEILNQYKSETKRIFGNDTDQNVFSEIIKNIKMELKNQPLSATDQDLTGIVLSESQSEDTKSTILDDIIEKDGYAGLAAIEPQESLEELCKDLLA